jgi:hypothetical protein
MQTLFQEFEVTNDLDRIDRLGMAELREERDRLQAIESGFSFGRRMAQGRIDIVQLELDRRARAAGAARVVDQLPGALAGQTRGAGIPRPIREHELPDFTARIDQSLDEIVSPTRLASLESLADTDLTALLTELHEFERRLSDHRRELHLAIDHIQATIVDRYRSGAASVDDLLS